MGASALAFGPGSQHCAVSRCKFADISGTAVRFGGIADLHEPNPALQTANLSISDCEIELAAVEFHSCAAIMVGYSRETRIVHNRLSNLSYTGISLNWGWGLLSYAANNVIAYNEISGAMCGELVDGGSVYNLGPQPGTRVHHNYLHRQCNLYGVLCECRGMTLSVGLPKTHPSRRSVCSATATACIVRPGRDDVLDGVKTICSILMFATHVGLTQIWMAGLGTSRSTTTWCRTARGRYGCCSTLTQSVRVPPGPAYPTCHATPCRSTYPTKIAS